MQTLMLDHFHREHVLMNSLPRSPSIRSHCDEHRQAHVNFSTRYNNIAASLNTRQPGLGAQELEQFILEWIRSHALHYDSKLAALMEA